MSGGKYLKGGEIQFSFKKLKLKKKTQIIYFGGQEIKHIFFLILRLQQCFEPKEGE